MKKKNTKEVILLPILDVILFVFRILDSKFFSVRVLSLVFFGAALVFSIFFFDSIVPLQAFFQESPVPVVKGLPVKVPHRDALVSFPVVTAPSILVADLNTARLLYAHDIHALRAPASTTKLMTVLVALDIYDLQDEVDVPLSCTDLPGNKLPLLSGEALTVEDLIHASLISSSNDAACTLANGKVSEEEFVTLMNNKAASLGMSATTFTNPAGLDRFDFSHISTARDIYLLGLAARKNDYLREVYAKSSYTLSSGAFPREIHTTNQLLGALDGTVGMKTGTTTQAGEVLMYEFSGSEKDLLIVLMGSSARYYDTQEILDWINTSYVWK